MQTVGQILKAARVAKKYSLGRVEEMTKIKSGFIDALEKEGWEKLPPFPTVLGFVKSVAGAVGVNERTAVAVLKRDYPPKTLSINPKPDVANKKSWSPKATFIVGIGAVLFVIFGYLVFQYVHFISSPNLLVESPKEGQEITSGSVMVFGTTEADVKLTVNNQPVLVDNDGKFSVDLAVTKETRQVDVIAISRSGKLTEIHRTIVPTGW